MYYYGISLPAFACLGSLWLSVGRLTYHRLEINILSERQLWMLNSGHQTALRRDNQFPFENGIVAPPHLTSNTR